MFARCVRDLPASSATRTNSPSASRARSVWWRRARSMGTVCAPRSMLVKRKWLLTGSCQPELLADQSERPLVGAPILEADEQNPLPLPKAQGAVRVGDLLGPRPEEERQ